MTDAELIAMARASRVDDRSDGALYGRLADRIEELTREQDRAEAEVARLRAALRAFADFDALPLEMKRPDIFELKVRRPILAALTGDKP